jgi:hypothetical protein
MTQIYRTFLMDPRDFPWAIRSIHSKSDFLVAKGNCAAAVDRSRGADGRRILARRSLFRSLNRAMETSAKMKFLLDQIEDVSVRCGPTVDFI